MTEEQTCYIFETRTIGFKDQKAAPVDDIIETVNRTNSTIDTTLYRKPLLKIPSKTLSDVCR